MTWRKPLIHSIFRLLRPGVLRELDYIKSIEKSSPAAIKDVQRERLQRLLHHAWNTTEYYRDVLEQCGAVKAGTVNLDRFDDIPFLTKDIIRSQASRLRTNLRVKSSELSLRISLCGLGLTKRFLVCMSRNCWILWAVPRHAPAVPAGARSPSQGVVAPIMRAYDCMGFYKPKNSF